MAEPKWVEVGSAAEFRAREVSAVTAERTPLAILCRNGELTCLSGVCNHAGGPLGGGGLDGDYLVCPWHYWKFHRATGEGEPGFEADRVPSYALKEEGGRLLVDLASATPRARKAHDPHPLERPLVREPGPVRVLGLSATAMTAGQPRFSASEHLLEAALAHAGAQGCETKLIRLRDLRFRACEGFYSKSAKACTWPCSITQMDEQDQMDQVYEGLVFWSDVVLVATPIRWGAASALYHQMAERLNCVQNQVTLRNRVLLKDKVAAFIIMGGQDNIQSVAGHLQMFFSELGYHMPQFPFIAHSRGWDAEDMERNNEVVQASAALREGAEALAERAICLAAALLKDKAPEAAQALGGRKAHRLG